MQRISVNVINDCGRNQLKYNNDLPALRNKNYALQKFFETDFLTVIGNAKLQRSFVEQPEEVQGMSFAILIHNFSIHNLSIDQLPIWIQYGQ